MISNDASLLVKWRINCSHDIRFLIHKHSEQCRFISAECGSKESDVFLMQYVDTYPWSTQRCLPSFMWIITANEKIEPSLTSVL